MREVHVFLDVYVIMLYAQIRRVRLQREDSLFYKEFDYGKT